MRISTQGMHLIKQYAEGEVTEDDVLNAERSVVCMVKVKMTQNEYDALTSLTYDLGSTKVLKSSLIRNLNQAKRIHTATLFSKMGGNIKRRQAEMKLFLGVE